MGRTIIPKPALAVFAGGFSRAGEWFGIEPPRTPRAPRKCGEIYHETLEKHERRSMEFD
jgi:hypothetical protein